MNGWVVMWGIVAGVALVYVGMVLSLYAAVWVGRVRRNRARRAR